PHVRPPRRPLAMFAPSTPIDNPQALHDLAAALLTYVRAAASQGAAAHDVERGIWQRLLHLGRTTLGHFLALQGSGDLGETVTLPDGQVCERLPDLHPCRYVSIFGAFTLQRTAYGSREGQKIDFVPLDNRLQLPASAFSYVLQDWDQGLCVEQAFGQAQSTVARMLGLNQSVGSLEQMNQQMAAHVRDFREDRPRPVPATEGPVLVTSGDGKGIVMRRAADDAAPAAHRTKGQKASQKRMAAVGTAYTVDRYVRTPEEVVAALFRDGPEPPRRPAPRHKRVWASLPQADAAGKVRSGLDIVCAWLLNEVAERNRGLAKEMVHLADGQDALWQARRDHLPARNTTDILDVLHVTPRLWQAAHVFCAEGSAEAEAFARERILRVLRGEVAGVVRGLRRMGTQRGLNGAKKKALAQVCAYLRKNRGRMRYDEYLAKGYPIASGVIEGACRHLVKDRMERAGMHWTPAGAQAMLDVRSTYVNGDWDEYQAYRIRRETNRLYPHRRLVEGSQYAMAV
ncbi:MAG: ISKra4 family transposase, partial [Actinobacteria bacterium]|nr:ISKra4 family transposase [Actinomycetota bacterium]